MGCKMAQNMQKPLVLSFHKTLQLCHFCRCFQPGKGKGSLIWCRCSNSLCQERRGLLVYNHPPGQTHALFLSVHHDGASQKPQPGPTQARSCCSPTLNNAIPLPASSSNTKKGKKVPTQTPLEPATPSGQQQTKSSPP